MRALEQILSALSNGLPLLSNGIPKFIHQSWKSKAVPEHWEASRKEWQALHPTWTYVFWTDEDIDTYIREWHANVYDIFKALEYPIQRVDLWRYFVLHDFGGLYCDLDIVPRVNVEQYLEACMGHVFLVPSANVNTVYTNALMASTTSPHAKRFWSSMVYHVSKWPETMFDSMIAATSKHLHIMKSTGPLGLTRVAKDSEIPITVLPAKLWNANDLSVADDLEVQKQNTIALTYIVNGSSWHSADSAVINFAHTYKYHLISLVFFVLVLYVLQKESIHEQFRKLIQRMKARSKIDAMPRS